MDICIYIFFFPGFRNLFPQLKGKCNKEYRKRKHVNDSFIKDTWTREFCSLPLIFSSSSPSLDLMNVLTKAGLVENQQFVETINKAYPRLIQFGGFTLPCAVTGGYGSPLTSLNTQWFHGKLLRRRFWTWCHIHKAYAAELVFGSCY